MPWDDGLSAGTPAYEIASSTNGRIRVVAGPGTGKSFAMKRRVARLLEEGFSPETILPVTFTRVAAEDLHRELIGMGVPGCESLTGTTLHSLAMRILMRNHVLVATGRTPRPLNDFETGVLEADLAAQFGGVREVQKLTKAYEAAWARLQIDAPGHTQSQRDAEFAQSLQRWMSFHEAMLIGEVIPQLHSYLTANPIADERSEFAHILVDEYQDLNRAEQGVIDLLSDNADVCIVGDDDQSIYSFKHAHPDGIRSWSIDHPLADDITLDECRRCPTRVVEMANSLILHNSQRPFPRSLTPHAPNGPGDVQIIQYSAFEREVVGVAEYVRRLITDGTPPGDILVLAQRKVIGTPIYDLLATQGVPTKSYYAEAELDDQDTQRRFAILKLFVDRTDKVALRWLIGLDGPKWRAPAYARVRSHCESSGATPWECLDQLSDGRLRIPHTNGLVAAFQEIRSEVSALEALSGLAEVVDSLFPDGNAAFRDIRALALQVIATYGDDDREKFFSELSTAITQPEIPSEVHEVRIMSLHKSKGLSSPVTIIAGCVEGLLPQQPEASLPISDQNAQLEEQRRLFYVGISRVKASPALGKPGRLVLTYSGEMPLAEARRSGISPASFSFGRARLLASRFIREMGPAAPRPTVG